MPLPPPHGRSGRACAAARRRAAAHAAPEAVLAANAADVAAARDELDAGALDRLRLDEERVAGSASSCSRWPSCRRSSARSSAGRSTTGCTVVARRIPIGVVGANFEARPGVALDVAGQLLKSLNACILRTGSAALATVTMLVDDVLRPALADVGLPPEAVGLVRESSRDGAVALVSLPHAIPLVILRGSGETTRRLARVAALEGVRVLAHAEGGGVLYVDAAADPGMTPAPDRGEPRPARRLQPAQPAARPPRRRGELAPALALLARLGARGLRDRARARARARRVAARRSRRSRMGQRAGAGRLGHRRRRGRPRRGRRDRQHADVRARRGDRDRGRARHADAFLDAYRGTAAFWNAPTRFTDGFALTGAPETGINVDFAPGPRGPVTYRDLWLRQLRVVGDGTQRR